MNIRILKSLKYKFSNSKDFGEWGYKTSAGVRTMSHRDALKKKKNRIRNKIAKESRRRNRK